MAGQVHIGHGFHATQGDTNLIIHGPLLKHIRAYFQKAGRDDTIFIFVPYVHSDTLGKLLKGIENRVAVITTWEPKDIQYGSTDIEAYAFCKDNGITLYLASGMHFKVYSVGLKSAMLATANVSHDGLLPGGNHEAAIYVDRLTNEDRMVLGRIIMDARIPDDEMYYELSSWEYHNTPNPYELGAVPPSLEELCPPPKKTGFLISSLPMTSNVNDLAAGYMRICQGLDPSEDPETAACVFHDLANYRIEPGMSRARFRRTLASRFLADPLVKEIDGLVAPGASVGSISRWVRNNCTDVPVPSSRKLAGNVRVLLEWLVELGSGRYVAYGPGARSYKIKRA